jgi:hypothetical protein
MSDAPPTVRDTVAKEAIVFLSLFLFGILVLPIAIYFVGQLVFGEYGGAGFSDFYGRLHYELRNGQSVSWYLVLSPYLGWQLARFTIHAFRRFRRQRSQASNAN